MTFFTANFACTVEQKVKLSTKRTLPVGWFWFTPLAVQGYNLNSKSPKVTTPAALSRFKNVIFRHIRITVCRKAAVVLKLSNFTFAEFFTSTAKI